MALRITLTQEILRGLKGGTLVEYVSCSGLSHELGRGTILDVRADSKSVSIYTSGNAYWGCPYYPGTASYVVNGVHYVLAPYIWDWFAIAPQGVSIPMPWEREWREPSAA